MTAVEAYASVFVGPGRAQTIEGVEPMGRGRAKAKQVKVARRLKYNTGGTDLDRLREELGATQRPQDEQDPYDDLADRYADYADDADDEESGEERRGDAGTR